MTNAGKRRALRSREPPQRLGESTRTDVARRTTQPPRPGPQARPLMRPKTGPALMNARGIPSFAIAGAVASERPTD